MAVSWRIRAWLISSDTPFALVSRHHRSLTGFGYLIRSRLTAAHPSGSVQNTYKPSVFFSAGCAPALPASVSPKFYDAGGKLLGLMRTGSEGSAVVLCRQWGWSRTALTRARPTVLFWSRTASMIINRQAFKTFALGFGG